MNDSHRNGNGAIERNESTVRSFQSIRTILEGLIFAGVLWLASGVQEQMKATVRLEAQLQAMSNEVIGLRAQLADIPAISRSLATIEVELREHERRISEIEAQRRHP